MNSFTYVEWHVMYLRGHVQWVGPRHVVSLLHTRDLIF